VPPKRRGAPTAALEALKRKRVASAPPASSAPATAASVPAEGSDDGVRAQSPGLPSDLSEGSDIPASTTPKASVDRLKAPVKISALPVSPTVSETPEKILDARLSPTVPKTEQYLLGKRKNGLMSKVRVDTVDSSQGVVGYTRMATRQSILPHWKLKTLTSCTGIILRAPWLLPVPQE